METLLIWDWKVEPDSPDTVYEETVLFDDSLATDEDLTAIDQKSTIVKDEVENKAEFIGKLLEEIEDFGSLDEFIKDESFSTWFEDKNDLPFEDLPFSRPLYYKEELKTEVSPTPCQYEAPQATQTPQDTTQLLREFETVFVNMEMSHNTLTPPQSPPQSETQVLATLQPVGEGFSNQAYYGTPRNKNIELFPATPQPDVAHELAVVEELVRSRAENLVDSWEEHRSPPPSSPSSNSSSGYSEYSSDPEWIPEPVQSSGLIDRSPKSRKRATKPYSRIAPEEKKSRKKEQNKNAATRYRMKKKQEVEEILSEEKGLLDHHESLENKVTDLQREIKYLKGLMRDLFKAKGLIK